MLRYAELCCAASPRAVRASGPPSGTLRGKYAKRGALVVWLAFMYCFWRVGTYLPGVPPPVDGVFMMKQVRVPC